MAILKGSVMGQFSGRIGDIVGRIVRGRTVLSRRPMSTKKEPTPAMVVIRQKFKVTTGFVKSLLTLAALTEVWNRVKTADMSIYNYSVKENFQKASTDKPSVDNILTPSDGFPLNVTTLEVAEDAITGTLEPLNTVGIFIDDESELTPNVVLCYYNPINANDAPYAIVPVKAQRMMLDPVNQLMLNIPLNVIQKQVAAKYQKSIIYLALTTHNAEGKVIQYSATYAQDN